MGGILFVALLFSLFALALLRGRREKNTVGAIIEEDIGSNYGNSAKATFGFPFLERIGYLLASNDEKDGPRYTPTLLQDVDPKDLA